ncbi:unnamed protein product [Linum tenue]|uniref:Uncharacterized protein n=1 Tax=Linum tenue TaxID=586396 RepID=A0AAV0ID82_9ROSI|nr:unnamed protein product [Linum tenue]
MHSSTSPPPSQLPDSSSRSATTSGIHRPPTPRSVKSLPLRFRQVFFSPFFFLLL